MGIIKRLTDSIRRSKHDESKAEDDTAPKPKEPNGEITKRFNTTLQMMSVNADELAARAMEECEGIQDETAKLARTLSGVHDTPDELVKKSRG